MGSIGLGWVDLSRFSDGKVESIELIRWGFVLALCDTC